MCHSQLFVTLSNIWDRVILSSPVRKPKESKIRYSYVCVIKIWLDPCCSGSSKMQNQCVTISSGHLPRFQRNQQEARLKFECQLGMPDGWCLAELPASGLHIGPVLHWARWPLTSVPQLQVRAANSGGFRESTVAANLSCSDGGPGPFPWPALSL